MTLKKMIQSILILSSILLANPPGTCWIIDDQTKTLYTFNMETLDAPIETAINEVNEGEGLAYRPSTQELYMWSDSDTIVRNTDTSTVIRQYETSYANAIEGASFYIDPISKEEELWVIVEENQENEQLNNARYIQEVDINTGLVIQGTRKKLHGGFMDSDIDYGNDIGSLAIDPKTKTFWITKDSDERKLANINPSTGEITNVKTLTPENMVDAEVLAFDINGIMYTESDRGDTDDDPRYLWKINPANATMSKATSQFGTGINGDLEGMACNSGADTAAQEPFTCTDTLFISNRSELGTGANSDSDTGSTWLHNIDRTTTPYSYNSIGEGYVSDNDGYNAMGYNVKDNFIYALHLNHLLKIDKNGVVKDLGAVEGLNPSQLYSGEFDRSGNYYVSIYGGGGSTLYKIDIHALKVTDTIPLKNEDGSTANVKFWDMAIDKTGDYFYMMIINYDNIGINERFAKLNISTGVISTIDSPLGFGNFFENLFGSGEDASDLDSSVAVVFSDKLGSVYAQLDEDGFYKIDTDTGKLYKLSSTQPLTFYNDATSCPDAIIDFTAKDFGDAPNQYSHVSHKISEKLYLGETVPDGESDQQSSAHASGDGADDNDGVVGVLPQLTLGDSSYTVSVKVFNDTGDIAYITAWIDFNRDGVFQYEEALNTNDLQIPSSTNPQIINIVWDNTTDGDTTAIENATVGKAIMRIRLTTSRIWRCDDPHYKENNGNVQENYFLSPDGEVEDYEIEIKEKGTPFQCTNEGHIFNSNPYVDEFTNGVTIDLKNGAIGDPTQFATRHINSAGYNVNDNFIYGIGYKNNETNLSELVKIDKDYKVESFTIEGLPQTYDNGGVEVNLFYAYGDISFDNKLYFSEVGELEKLRIIDLETKTLLPSIPLIYPDTNSTKIKSADYAFNPKDEMLYVVNSHNHQLTRINPTTGVVTELGNVGLANENLYSVISFFDLKGNYYFNNAEAKRMFKINISNPDDVNATATPYLNDLNLTKSGDGAKCAYSYISEKDYGDAPESYPHVGHEISANLYLGNHAPDEESDQQSSLDALGDGEDDSDGVIDLLPITLNSTSYSVPVKVYNKTGKDAYITAWIDFNRNGTFEVNEALSNENLTVGSSPMMQETTIKWNNPIQFSTLTVGSHIMRIRISTTQIAPNDISTNSPDGEVEDYIVNVVENRLYGKFNIERTNSNEFSIMSDERNAWYTQIVGRDFNYSLVFYKDDFSKEQNISNVTVKIDLMDMDRNTSIYNYLFHIPTTVEKSRIDILNDNDLDKLPATRNARFKVTYGIDDEGGIIKADCLTHPEVCTQYRSNLAQDNFAIRPETFYVTVHDKTKILRNSRANESKALRLSAGYDYNLTVVATQYKVNNTIVPSPQYDTAIERWLRFVTPGRCANSTDHMDDEIFKDGNNTTNLMQLNEVGTYTLEIKDENWTAVDQNHTNPELSGCLLGNEIERFTPNSEGKVGCTIQSSIYDMNLSFQPYQFKIELPIEEDNIPNSSHPDFLYMMNNINGGHDDVAIQFEGNITAQAKGDINTTNFTKGCVAKDVKLSLLADTLSEDGINQIIRTSPSHSRERHTVDFTRIIRYNEDSDNNNLDTNQALERINSDINISANKFLNENNGTVHLQIRYNLNKNSSETINPVQVTFKSFEANATQSFSEANSSSPYYPLGHQNLEETIRNFYFAQVAPDRVIYPMVNCLTHSTMSTPINVDIFCDKNLTYCTQTGIMNHTEPLSSPRASAGFYSSTDHNHSVDGDVTDLEHSGYIRTQPNPDIADPLEFTQGRNGMLTTKFIGETKERISIVPSSALLFNPNPSKDGRPEYQVSCSNDYNNSEWTGIGKQGHTLDIKSNAKEVHKMDW